MKAKFTNGPWSKARSVQFEVTNESNDWNEPAWCEVVDKNGMVTAIVPTLKVTDTEMDANRNLISCAPEMYDILDSIENDNGQVPEFMWDKIQSILAKARGEL